MKKGKAEPWKVPEKITRITDKAIACRKFFGSFLIDKKLIKEGTVFFNGKTWHHIESVLLEDHWRLFQAKGYYLGKTSKESLLRSWQSKRKSWLRNRRKANCWNTEGFI